MARNELADFEWWVTCMPEALEKFMSDLPPLIARELDYSPESLSTLERWLVERYPNTEAIRASELLDGVARYIGETFRRNLGGRWDISFKRKSDINYGLPVVVGYPGETTPLCPYRLAIACAGRRSGVFLASVFKGQSQ
jgi:hypothetical protein